MKRDGGRSNDRRAKSPPAAARKLAEEREQRGYAAIHGVRQTQNAYENLGIDPIEEPHSSYHDSRGEESTFKPPQPSRTQPAMHEQAGGEEPTGLVEDKVSGAMGRCSKCSRSFFVEKLEKHERVCQGM